MPLGTPPNKPNQPGTGFTNLSRYLQANRQNRLGQTISSNVQQAGQQARGAIGQAGQEFKQEVGQERSRLGEQESKVGQILGGNVAGVSDPDLKTFHNVLGAESKGPTSLRGADELRSQTQEAEALGRAGSSEAGRFGLLQRYVGRGSPTYGAGQQRLDQMLLGQTGQEQLRQGRAGTIGLGSRAERQIGAAVEQGKELQSEARNLAEATKGKLGQKITDYDTAMAAQLASQEAKYQQLIDLFKPGENAPIELEQSAIDKLKAASAGYLDVDKQLYNVDVSPYLGISDLYKTRQGAQTAEDFARLKGLERLGDKYIAGRPEEQLLQSYTVDPTMVGKFEENPFETQNLSELDKKINEAKAKLGVEAGASWTRARDAASAMQQTAMGLGRYAPQVTSNQMAFGGADEGYTGFEKALQREGVISPDTNNPAYNSSMASQLQFLREEAGRRRELDKTFQVLRQMKLKGATPYTAPTPFVDAANPFIT